LESELLNVDGFVCSQGRTMACAREQELQQEQEAENRRAILVVEDEVLVRMMITDQLRNVASIISRIESCFG
jgi:hypothetical protein